MSPLTQRISRWLYAKNTHPYRIYDAEIAGRLTPATVVLDAGCGRSPGIATLVRSHAVKMAIGIDSVVTFPQSPNCHIIRGNLTKLPLNAGTVDLVITRSVMEHLEQPEEVYREFHRVLRAGGSCIMLTPNLWDYASIGASVIPNRFHPWLVARMEGREEADTFPTFYRANSLRTIRRLASLSGFDVETERCLGQYPSYFQFNAALFLLASAYEKLVSRFEVLRQLRGWLFIVLHKPVAKSGVKDSNGAHPDSLLQRPDCERVTAGGG